MPNDEMIDLLGRRARRVIGLVLAAVALLAPGSFAAGFRAVVRSETARVASELRQILPQGLRAGGPAHPSTRSAPAGAAARR